MPRKPFEALGPHNLVCDCHAKADAAIAQDKEYALRRIREENHEGMIYYRERDEARAERDAYKKAKAENDERFQLERDQARMERDALRAENEKLREQCDRYDHIIPSMAKGRNDFRSALKKTRDQLAEAVKVIEMIDARELNLEHSWSRRILEETARAFLAKVKP